jgi:tetratricopeptide (TPR) repeat protein
LITITGAAKGLFKTVMRNPFSSDKPGKIILWPIWVVIAIAVAGAFMEWQDFPMNGNPFVWSWANSKYEEARAEAKKHNRLLAISKFQGAIDIYPDDYRYHRDLAQEKRHTDNLDDALKAIDAAIRLAPGKESLYLDKMDIQQMREDMPAARAAVDKALSVNPGSPEAVVAKSFLLACEKNHQADASTWFAKTRSLSRDTPRFWLYTGMYYSMIDKPQEAEAAFRQACEIEPDNPDYNAFLGDFLASTNSFAEAQYFLNRAAELDPHCAAYWKKLVIVLSRLKEWSKAEAALGNLCDLQPGDWSNWEMLGRIRYQLQDYKSAARSLQRAADLHPQSLATWDMLLDCLERDSRFAEARIAITRFMAVSPANNENPVAWTHLGNLFKAENKYDEAKQAFEHALSLHPAKKQEEFVLASMASMPNSANNTKVLQARRTNQQNRDQSAR